MKITQLTPGLFLCLLSYWANAATVGFKPAVTYSVGTGPHAIAVADFDGDGKSDLAVADVGNAAIGDDGGISILLGNGDGTFQPANNMAGGKNPLSLAAGDFNGDHRFDLVTVNAAGNTLSVLLGNGNGTFQSQLDYPVPAGLWFVTTGDFNGDHRLDLVASGHPADVVSVFLGNGDGTFQSHVDYPAGMAGEVVVADFNQDGRADLAIAGNFNGGIVGIMKGNGDGTFQPAVAYDPVPRFGEEMTPGDFDGDGQMDLVVLEAIGFASKPRLLLGNGDGSFSQGVSLLIIGCYNHDPVAADFDGNGKLDFAVFHFHDLSSGCSPFGGRPASNPSIAVFSGNGNGTFQPSLELNMADNLRWTRVADLNGDKALDLVAVNSNQNGANQNTISVLLNTGTDFSISASKPKPATLNPGQSSTSTVSLSLLNAFDNPVALTCSVQPATAGSPTCSLNPSSVIFDSNRQATATLTINTATASALLRVDSLRPGSSSALLWLPVSALALAGTGFGRRRSTHRKLMGYLLGGILMVGLIFQAGCGGSTGSSGNNTRQSVTYTITVTATSGSTQRSTTVPLTVQ